MIGLLWQLYTTFFRIGAFSFGGGYAIIPLLQKEIVDVHHWLSVQQMVDVIAISQMTPGPIAINAATLVGYYVGGIAGSVVATLGVVTPATVLLLIVSRFFWHLEKKPGVQMVLRGLRPMVVALIAAAGLQMSGTVLADLKGAAIMLAALIASVGFKINPILVIAGAGLAGILLY